MLHLPNLNSKDSSLTFSLYCSKSLPLVPWFQTWCKPIRISNPSSLLLFFLPSATMIALTLNYDHNPQWILSTVQQSHYIFLISSLLFSRRFILRLFLFPQIFSTFYPLPNEVVSYFFFTKNIRDLWRKYPRLPNTSASVSVSVLCSEVLSPWPFSLLCPGFFL